MSDPALLIVAAEKREVAGLLKHSKAVKKLSWGVDFASAGELNGRRILVVANGAGPVLAAEAVEEARRREEFSAIVSTGFCGALDPALAIGDILVALAVVDGEGGKMYPTRSPISTGVHSAGNIISVNRVAGTVNSKRELRDRGGNGVEMEAAGVALAATRLGVPFYCIRSVSDLAGEEFAVDFNAVRDVNGRFQVSRIIAAALRKPLTSFPALMRLAGNARIAARSLGDFFADCRF